MWPCLEPFSLVLMLFMGAPDTLGDIPPSRIMDPVHVTGRLMTLDEIMERATEGERTKLAGHRDMTYTASGRQIIRWKHRKLHQDTVYLVYEDDTGLRKQVELTRKKQYFREEDEGWVPEKDGDDDEGSGHVSVEVEQEGEGLSRLPFFLEEPGEYTFSLLDRRLEGDHVIFKIAFEPRSPFKPLPSGTVYVDTNDFRIVHEEFTFKQNPFPLLVRDIRKVSRHWKRLPGGEWVAVRIMAEVRLRGSWTKVVPEEIEVGILLEDYVFDRGYDPRRFGPRE